MKKGVIYANISEDHRFALGYLNWYKNQFRYQATSMLQRQVDPDMLGAILERLEKEKFHFASRIRKTHHVNIPVDVILMKLKGFIREVADKVIDSKTGPEMAQLEFKF